MSTPWYSEGLKFSCTGCGGCCSGEPGYVWIDKDEIEAMAKALGVKVGDFQRRFVRTVDGKKSLIEIANGDCIFLHNESRTCTVYEVRPAQCRSWPFWKSNLATPKAWKEAQERCPGCRRGRVVSLEKIQERME